MNPTVAIRLPPEALAQVDRIAKDSAQKRSDVIRDILLTALKKRRS
jgi:metal-responsive CopG/Arc/MetJ family transcriptional regulator